ncbi:MAG: LytR C-terminal domain-containing protein [Actinomycetaceae bacterium]|nr:LytR C-terminal domain-containing protein [Actinomycetaceae bacterium]
MSTHEYPEDEFDEAGKDAPAGVHRQPQSQWKAVLPFLVVLVVAPLLAWGAATFYTSQRGTVEPAVKETPVATSESETATTDAGASTAAPTSAPTQAATQDATATPTAETDRAADKIEVLNGTGTSGLAAEVAERIKTLGYENVDANNAEGWASNESAVYYHAGKEKAAEEIAQLLSIDMRQENSEVVGDKAVIVLLRPDFEP